ncbi:preprotein translocase subunit SecA [Priestia megaterium]|nr:preprotein translocase subunit SecA [Priestia megaterium]
MLKSVFDFNHRTLAKYQKIVQKINDLESTIQPLNDNELKEKTNQLKQKLQNGQSLEDILPEAFATVREASIRVLGMRHYDVQLMGGMALHFGNIAEMKTGEGKTLVATLPLYLNALAEKGVHLVTANEYLAARDAEEMGKIFTFLGLTVGLNVSNMSTEEKKAAYATDITYGTNNEFGFDYLRDNMAVYQEQISQRPLYYAIVDEVDSILIDEARTPLIISGAGDKTSHYYEQANAFVRTLSRDTHFIVDEKKRNIQLSDEGIIKAEKFFHLENLFDLAHSSINHHINQALKAHHIMKRDIDYVVQNSEVIIIDQFTGRMMDGRRYSDGLHQAIEAKEAIRIQQESQTMATITFQNYFRMYEKLAGMTGTAKTEEAEFQKIYKMDAIVIPTNRPIARIDKNDIIYQTMNAKFAAVIEKITSCHKKEQPVLVGTANIETSEYLSTLLKKKGIKHNVLNAKNHEKEAEIVSNAGIKGAVTIATNMAGRGTDIKLGDGVNELGGLCVIGTEKHESRRIDNQLRGRSGRQGDNGESIFYLSLEDEVMRRFGSENVKNIMEKLKIDEHEAIESKIITKSVSAAQKRVEGNNFDTRKRILEYDDVLNQQRNIIYSQRREVLFSDNLQDSILKMFQSALKQTIHQYLPSNILPEEWDLQGFEQKLLHSFFSASPIDKNTILDKEIKEIQEELFATLKTEYATKEGKAPTEAIREFEKFILLKVIDEKWVQHIDAMDQLRQGIHLRSYGQTEPLRAYQDEGFEMFETMVAAIEMEVSTLLLKASIETNVKREKVAEGTASLATNGEEEKKKPFVNKDKVGRNEPCPCGSGKKYKQCHGR